MTGTTDPPRARIVHRIPGRMRVRFARGSVVPEALSDLSRTVLEVKGVDRCDASGSTACLLIHIDEASFDDRKLARTVGGIADAPMPRQRSAGQAPAAPDAATPDATIRGAVPLWSG